MQKKTHIYCDMFLFLLGCVWGGVLALPQMQGRWYPLPKPEAPSY